MRLRLKFAILMLKSESQQMSDTIKGGCEREILKINVVLKSIHFLLSAADLPGFGVADSSLEAMKALRAIGQSSDAYTKKILGNSRKFARDSNNNSTRCSLGIYSETYSARATCN